MVPFLHCNKIKFVMQVVNRLRWWKEEHWKRETVETCKLNIHVVPFLHCVKSALVIQVTYSLRWWNEGHGKDVNSRNMQIKYSCCSFFTLC